MSVEGVIIEINKELCGGCFECGRVCPFGCLDWIEIEDGRVLLKPYCTPSASINLCAGDKCLLCVKVCHKKAIKVL